MKILVCMKQVPQKDAPLKLNEAAPGSAKTFPTKSMNPTPMRSKKRFGRRKSTAGKSSSSPPARLVRQQVLREALAKGADRAIHLEDDAFRRT